MKEKTKFKLLTLLACLTVAPAIAYAQVFVLHRTDITDKDLPWFFISSLIIGVVLYLFITNDLGDME